MATVFNSFTSWRHYRQHQLFTISQYLSTSPTHTTSPIIDIIYIIIESCASFTSPISLLQSLPSSTSLFRRLGSGRFCLLSWVLQTWTRQLILACILPAVRDIILAVFFGRQADMMAYFVAFWQSQMWPEEQATVYGERSKTGKNIDTFRRHDVTQYH